MDRPRLAVLTALAVFAVPAAAQAAPVKIGPKPSSTSATTATVEVANPNRYALRGTASVAVRSRTVASRSVRLAKVSVSTVRFSFDAKGAAAVRAADGRATVKLALRRGARKTTAQRTMTLRLGPSPAPAPGSPAPAPGTKSPAPSPSPAPGGTPGSNPQPDQPASNRWTGRMGTDGAYDDLEFTLANGQIQITKTPLVPVYCFEMGGLYRTALSFEPFVVTGPWTLGQNGSVQQSGIAVNQLVSGGSRGITYKVEDTVQAGGTVTGKLGMSYFDSKYDIFANKIWFVNCSGSQSFEAIPAA